MPSFSSSIRLSFCSLVNVASCGQAQSSALPDFASFANQTHRNSRSMTQGAKEPADSTIVITTLAMYQTEFWALVAQDLARQGRRCVFISFDDRSSEYLRARDIKTYSPTEAPFKSAPPARSFDAALAHFGIDRVNFWLSHERVTFAIRDSALLKARLQKYLEFADQVLQELRADGPVSLVQEVGGFVSVIACFFAARRLDIDNWFIEPSFFRGRLFFTRNTFEAPEPPPGGADISAEVSAYLERTLRS